MLNEERPTATDDDLPRPPAGRRSSRRAAGPPAPIPPLVDVIIENPPVAASDEPKPAVTAVAPALTTQTAPIAAEPESESPLEPARKAVRKRVSKKAVDPHQPVKRTTRKRVNKKTTAQELPIDDEPNREDSAAENPIPPVTEPSPEPVSPDHHDPEDHAAASPVAEPDELPASVNPELDASEFVADDSPEEIFALELSVPDLESVTVSEPDPVPTKKTKPRYRQPFTAVSPEEQPSDDDAPTRRYRNRPLPSNPFAPPKVLSAVETEHALQELAYAIARGSTAVPAELSQQPVVAAEPEPAEEEQVLESAVEEAVDGVESDADSIDDDDDQPRRRRRRRGGRRRRRNRDKDEIDDSDTEEEEEVEEAAPTATETEADNDDASDSTRRRRRRRRRRGDETDTEEDDTDAEVVVRVREPRRRNQQSTDEVSGIDGSTRMEAKKQRRREGRAAGRRRAPILSEAEFLSRRESVTRIMAIRQHTDYNQIAVLEDGILVEHYVDRATASSLIGNIYLGKVQNVLPSMEAAFIDIGRGRNAVLYAGEVDWDAYGDAGQTRKMEQVFKSGQSVLVQVTKDPVGAKGARLTSHISIPGRYIVYSPGGDLSGISRKLPDSERQRLKGILDGLIGEEASVIVRTAAEGASEDDLVRDVNRLTAQWDSIQKKVKQGVAPALLYSEPDATVRIVRDLFTEDFSKLIVSGDGSAEDTFDMIDGYVAHVAPHLKERMERWDDENGDIFADFRVDEQIAKALERKVFLPSGGSLIIDRTEAMTVIDVNTGKFTGTGGNLEATVTSNNLEAAEEIVRQLRLRDIGGIIVIDFIDMVLPSNRELLLRRLVECLGRDRTRHQVAEVTSLGLVQLTRKKISTGLAEAFTEPCECCKGKGYLRCEEPVDSQAPADGGERSANKVRPQRNRGGGRGGKVSGS